MRMISVLQDTNALVFRALLAALGLSAANGYDMNSLAVPRKAKEAIGAITRLTKTDGSGAMTVNVEYNQLDPLLRSTINKDGDVNDESGECMGQTDCKAWDRHLCCLLLLPSMINKDGDLDDESGEHIVIGVLSGRGRG
jgi:hypothetical protein